MGINQKGFVNSIDALFGLGIALVFFILASYYIGQVDSGFGEELSLGIAGQDIGIVLEKSGILERSVVNGGGEINSFFSQLPYNICLGVSVFEINDLNNSVLNVQRQGCILEYSVLYSGKRSFVGLDKKIYLAEISVWGREG